MAYGCLEFPLGNKTVYDPTANGSVVEGGLRKYREQVLKKARHADNKKTHFLIWAQAELA